MKLKSSLLTCLLALGVTAALPAQDIKLNIPGKTDPAAPAVGTAPAAAPAAPAAPAFTDAQILEEYGWFIGKRVGLAELNFTADQIDAMVKGFIASSKGNPAPLEIEKVGPLMDELIKKKQDLYVAKLKQKGLQESIAFFTEIKKKAGVISTPTGLCYEIIKPGEGPAPKPTETVKFNYIGALVNGTTFADSTQPGAGGPAEIQLDQVVPGWTEGLQKISKGGKIRLYVPPHLAYGDEGRPGIPPASTLIFEVELLDIKPTAPAPAAAATPAPAPTGK